MKQPGKDEIDKLERTLATAHGLREAPQLSDRWRESVMRDIRRRPFGVPALSEVPYLVWRAAAVVALVSTLLVGSLMGWNAGRADADLSAIFAVATVDPSLLAGEP